MKNLFKYEINESIAAKAAMNCVHKRLFKEFYYGHPTPQEEVMRGEYDPYEWEMDAYGNGDKRELVHQALVDLKCTKTEEEGWQYNNIIQKLINDKNPKITNLEDAKDFVRDYASDLGVVIKPEISEQEEDGINKGGMHNLVQHGHIMNTPSMHDELEPEFSDLKEQEGYNMNFRAIAELVADQIDDENPEAKGV